MASSTKKPDTPIRLFYGLGAVPYGIKDHGFNFFLLIFYSQVLGLSPVFTSLALSIAIAVDAISDPIVGYVSDNWRSRWGRRHPFMYVAIVPICLSYVFLWNPPPSVLETQSALFVYLVALAVFVRILVTFFEVPNSALISELTDDYDLRTGLMGLRYMFGWLGGIGMAFLGYSVFLSGEGGVLNAAGYGPYGIAAAVLMFIGMMVSSIGTHRTITHLHVPQPRARTSIKAVIAELWQILRNHSFAALFVASIFSGTAVGTVAALSIYFATFFWGLTPAQLAFFSIMHALAACCALPIAYTLGKRFEKKQAAIVSFIFMIIAAPAMLLARMADLLPPNGSDLLFYMLSVHAFVEVMIIIVFYTLFGAMMADVVEDIAVDTTRRSEGVIFAARGFAAKMVSGLGVLIAGVIITASNLPQMTATPENVPPEVLRDLVLYTVPTQVFFYVMALLILRRYRITRKQHTVNVDIVSEKIG